MASFFCVHTCYDKHIVIKGVFEHDLATAIITIQTKKRAGGA